MFGGSLLAFLALRGIVQHRRGRRSPNSPRAGGVKARWAWPGPASIVAIVLAALITHMLRDAREADLEMGRALVRERAYRAALEALTRADRWPSTARPGRIDHVRAEAYLGLGDRRAAELAYLRADRADPTYFWTVADLALFYASSSESLAERRRLVEPYAKRLRSKFVGNPDVPKILTRIERQLVDGR